MRLRLPEPSSEAVSRQNKVQELDHARKILHNPEFYWNCGTLAGKTGSIRRARWIADAARLGPGVRVLEVGCGTGFFSEIFSAAGCDLTAIDISPELLERARQRGPLNVRFEVQDIERLPYPDGSFDAAVGVRVLHHLDLEVAFSEIGRVLRSGGRISFCEPNMLNPQIMIQKNVPYIKRMMGDTPDETAFIRWPLRRFLERRGFHQIQIEPFDFLHPWVPDRWVRSAERFSAALEHIPALREIAGSLRIVAVKA
jgi:SAM-dependent methyltransferase